MDINVSLPDEIRTYVEEQVTAGGYSTASEYFLDLVRQDQQRRKLGSTEFSQEKLEMLLLEGLNSGGSQEVTPEFWQNLRDSVLQAEPGKGSEQSEE